jgi:hypothetical protein
VAESAGFFRTKEGPPPPSYRFHRSFLSVRNERYPELRTTCG